VRFSPLCVCATVASVVRGQRVSCLRRSATWKVTNWQFTPDASSETGASLPIVRERSTSREWAGIAAIGGVVRVYVTNGVEQRTMRKGLRRGGPKFFVGSQRRRSESNRRMEVLQTSALPLGYGAGEREASAP
jgi:hypothetical protein